MDKAALEVNEKKVLRMLMGGALTGASAAALLNLLRTAREGRDKLVAASKPVTTDKDTLVLTLPPKLAESVGCEHIPVSREYAHKYDGKQNPAKASEDGARRNEDGKFKQAQAATGWPTLTAGTLAALGGGTLGYLLIEKILRKQRQHELERQLEAAQTEYLDQLVGKQASFADAFLPEMSTEKTAREGFLEAPGFLSWPIAAAALLTIMGTGGAGYLTKRFLDLKAKEQDTAGLDLPKVKRIVFQTATGPTADVSKTASQEDVDGLKAVLAVKIAHLSGDPDHILTPDLLKEAGPLAGVLSNSQASMDELLEAISKMPAVRDMLWNTAASKHKILSMLSSVAEKKPIIGDAFNKYIKGPLVSSGIKKQISALGTKAKDLTKRSDLMALPSTAQILGSVVGSTIAGKPQSEDLAKQIVAAQEAIQAEKKKETEEDTLHDVVDVVAKDPAAAAYIASNQAKIKAVVRKMLKDKQL